VAEAPGGGAPHPPDATFPLERIPQGARDVAARLREAGYEAYFVGGAVRDVLVERAGAAAGPADGAAASAHAVDIATSATPGEVQRLFRRTVPIGVEHGTVAVLDALGAPHEVTTFRRDVETDGRHAVVRFGVSLAEDLARRDFTINAIAVHPESGALVDPFGGRSDLAARLVRAVGDPAQRFLEDRLRILRALRFAAVLGFEIEDGTWRALHAQADALEHLSRERVRDEWLRTLEAPLPGAGVLLWKKAGVLGPVWPEMLNLPAATPGRVDASEVHDPVLITAALLFQSGASPEQAEGAARRLRFSNRDTTRVRGVVAALADTPPAPGQARDVRRWLSRHRDVSHDALAVAEPRARRGDLLAAVRAVETAGDPLSVRELAVSGADLTAEGIATGRRVGEVLRALLDEVLDEPWRNSREQLLQRARELAR